ncbi:MAG: CDP-alcohol phosphatidyltransferase family protein [Actinomycetota bacterium]
MTEGERWTREVLRELQTRRYVPAAWFAFLGTSFHRFGETRPAHRGAERQVVVLTGLGLAGAGVLTLGRGAAAGTAAAAWWLAVMLMVELHLGMLERPDRTPLHTLSAPNLLSLVRAALVPPLLLASPTLLAFLLAAAGATDVLDGFVARRFDLATRLGQWLDGSIDAVVTGVAAVALFQLGLLPLWVALLVAARVLAPWIVIAAAYFVRAEAPPGEALVPGRLTGLMTLGGLVLVAAGAPAGVILLVAGILGGFATFGASVARAVGGGAS